MATERYHYLARLYRLGDGKFTINTTRAQSLLNSDHFKDSSQCWCKTCLSQKINEKKYTSMKPATLHYHQYRVKYNRFNERYSHVLVDSTDLRRLVKNAKTKKKSWITVNLIEL